MARQDSVTFQGKYNSVSTGLFKDQTAQEIEADDFRALITDLIDSFLNNATDFKKLSTASGTNTYTISDTSFPGYSSGFMAVVKFTNASTGSVTLNINSVGAKKVYTDASTQAGNGTIPANTTRLLVYDTTLDSAAGGFMILGGGSSGAGLSSTDIDTIAEFNAILSDGDFATLASPTFTGTPAAPTAATSTNTTQIATTAFVQQEIAANNNVANSAAKLYLFNNY
jgi:hypothetical protein